MVTGFRVLWRALVNFWDESMLMIKANVIWFIGSVPLYLLTVLVCSIFIPPIEGETGPSIWSWLLSALLLLVIPTPLAAGVYAVANFVANDETPEFSIFWQAVKRLWLRVLAMYLIGASVLGALFFNASFYMALSSTLTLVVGVLWLYALLFWLSMQGYLLPLQVGAAIPVPPSEADDGWPLDDERRAAPAAPPPPPEPHVIPMLTLYKRAAILALANPLLSIIMLLAACISLVASFLAFPVYPLLAASFVALLHCRGLRTLREKYFPTEARGAIG